MNLRTERLAAPIVSVYIWSKKKMWQNNLLDCFISKSTSVALKRWWSNELEKQRNGNNKGKNDIRWERCTEKLQIDNSTTLLLVDILAKKRCGLAKSSSCVCVCVGLRKRMARENKYSYAYSTHIHTRAISSFHYIPNI